MLSYGSYRFGMNRCILCSGDDIKILEDTGKGYKVVMCKGCSLVYVTPIPEIKFIEEKHQKDYYTPWLKEQRKKRIRMWRERLKTLNSLFTKKGKLLDIGCGEGLFLELAKNNGWDVTGTEVSPFAVSYGKERLGLQILQGEIMNIRFPDKSFDVVTMWHVLEHTIDPIATLKEVRRIIKDDGVFILAIPNLNNILSQWVYRIAKGRKMHLFAPEDRELHLFHFTKETIKLALEKTGFKMVTIMPDMGIVRWKIKILNYIAYAFGYFITGEIITDAIEIHAIPS